VKPLSDHFAINIAIDFLFHLAVSYPIMCEVNKSIRIQLMKKL